MADTVAASGLSSYMVAMGEADTSAILNVIRNTQHHNSLLATKPGFKWRPRDGRNAQYTQYEEHLRTVARTMGIKEIHGERCREASTHRVLHSGYADVRCELFDCGSCQPLAISALHLRDRVLKRPTGLITERH